MRYVLKYDQCFLEEECVFVKCVLYSAASTGENMALKVYWLIFTSSYSLFSDQWFDRMGLLNYKHYLCKSCFFSPHYTYFCHSFFFFFYILFFINSFIVVFCSFVIYFICSPVCSFVFFNHSLSVWLYFLSCVSFIHSFFASFFIVYIVQHLVCLFFPLLFLSLFVCMCFGYFVCFFLILFLLLSTVILSYCLFYVPSFCLFSFICGVHCLTCVGLSFCFCLFVFDHFFITCFYFCLFYCLLWFVCSFSGFVWWSHYTGWWSVNFISTVQWL